MIENSLADPSFSGRVCLVLLHSVWQAALLLMLTRCIERLWRQRTVEQSYAVNVAALAAVVAALPVTYFLLGRNAGVAVPPAAARQLEIEADGEPLRSGQAEASDHSLRDAMQFVIDGPHQTEKLEDRIRRRRGPLAPKRLARRHSRTLPDHARATWDSRNCCMAS